MGTGIIIWLVIGILLILAETIVPGAVLSFLGIAAIGVGLLLHFDVIDSFKEIALSYMGISLFLLLVVRTIFLKMMPGDESVGDVDEDVEIRGAIVEVIQEIRPENEGRVRYRDSTWVAQSEHLLKEGDSVVIENKIGQKLIVKPIH